MKKKLFTLMTLLLCLCSTAWGAITAHDLSSSNFTKDFSSESNATIDDGTENWGMYFKGACSISSQKLALNSQNMKSSNYWVSVPLTGVAKDKIIVVTIASSVKIKFAVDEKTDYTANYSGTEKTVDPISSTVTYNYKMTGNEGNAVLYFGRTGSNVNISSITIKVADPIENPVFTYATGNYYVGLIPEITCATDGTTIYYKNADKDNRKDITSTGTISAQTSAGAKTFSAYAQKDGVYSDIVKATYTIENLPTPTTDVAGGTYSTTQNVSFTNELLPNGVIKYTTNGSTPSWSSTSYDGTPISISSTTTLKAYAFETTGNGNKKSSSMFSATYTIVPRVDPVFTLSSTSIATNETAQIKVGDNDGLDGVTLSNLTYDTEKMTISEAGVITPKANSQGGPYNITFTTAATSKYNAGSGNLSITFEEADETAPSFVSSSPADGATNVAVSGTIVLTFDEAIGTVDATKFTLSKGTKGTIAVDGTDATKVNVAFSAIPYNTEVTLSVAAGAVADAAGNESAALDNITFTTIKEPMHKPTISGQGYFIGSQTVSISSDVEGAAITYSLDGQNYNAYSEPFEITASKTVYAKATHADYYGEGSAQMAMYLISIPAGQEDVTATTTWDFTNANALKPGSDITNNPKPQTQLLSAVTEYASSTSADQITFINPERYDDSGYAQAHGFIINTTKPGTLSIDLTGTNSNTRNVIVNGEKKGASTSTGNKSINNIVIPAGATIVYAFDVTSNPNAANNLRWKKITFTAVENVSAEITESGWNTFSSNYALDLSSISGGKAYVATTTSSKSVKVEECTDIVAAGTGLMINGTPGETFTINTTADDATFSGTNLLEGLPNGGTVAANAYNYVFAWPTATPADYGFYYVNDTEPTLPAGKAYLHVDGGINARLNIVFDGETTGINTIENSEMIIENSDAPMYNLAGQKVNKSYKGVVIVNGKKIVRK